MMKITNFFISKRGILFVICIICVLVLSVILLTSGLTKHEDPKLLDEAVSLAIKAQSKGYGSGEVATEGHIILDTEEKSGITKVYTISSLGVFGFENGVFTIVSGSGAIATVMTFAKNEIGEYSLIEYKEPTDGAGNLESKKKMFPIKLWGKVLSEQKYYPDLIKQQEEQAKQYLQKIGRDVKVSAAHVEKKLSGIDVEASNKLISNRDLSNFPYWIGTKEMLQNGVRYIYETSQGKTSDGYDLIIYKKTKEDGSIVSEYKYKIVGNEPQLIN